MTIEYNRPFIAGRELFLIAQAVIDKHLAGDGQFTKQCQTWLESELGCRRAFLTHSCTGAIEMAALLCDVKPGDEVIMPSFTFVSTANAFALRGAVPVFVDIREDTLNLDETKIEAAITPRTRVIVPMHYAGVACDMDRIMAIAAKHGILVVEDAAHAMFARYGDKHLGTIGHLGCLSFHETKNVISGEGGALLVNDERFCQRGEIVREKGTNRSQFFRGEVDKYTWVDIGSSFLPSEITAAFLFAQLEHADRITASRRERFLDYLRLLEPLEQAGFVRVPRFPAGTPPNGHIFYLLTRSLEERTKLIAYLRQKSIYAVFHYVPLHSSPAGRKYGRTVGELPVTDQVSDRLVRLPLFHELTREQVETVVAAVTSFYQG